MSISPERRFATSPKHEMLKRVFKKPQLTVSTSPKKMSLLEHKKRETEIKRAQHVSHMEEQIHEMSTELRETRDRVNSISKKLDFIMHHLCGGTLFEMDDI